MGSNDLLDSQTDPCSSHVISQEKYQEQDTFPNMPQALALGGLASEPIIQSPTDYLYPIKPETPVLISTLSLFQRLRVADGKIEIIELEGQLRSLNH